MLTQSTSLKVNTEAHACVMRVHHTLEQTWMFFVNESHLSFYVCVDQHIHLCKTA